MEKKSSCPTCNGHKETRRDYLPGAMWLPCPQCSPRPRRLRSRRFFSERRLIELSFGQSLKLA
jgi:hypothetical protein